MFMKNKIVSREPRKWFRAIILIKGRLKNGHKTKRRDFEVELAAEPTMLLRPKQLHAKRAPK